MAAGTDGSMMGSGSSVLLEATPGGNGGDIVAVGVTLASEVGGLSVSVGGAVVEEDDGPVAWLGAEAFGAAEVAIGKSGCE